MANLRVDKITSTETFETTGSVQFDGVDDVVTAASDGSDYNFGTGDFTIEFWALWNDDPTTSRYILDARSGAGTDNCFSVTANYTGSDTLFGLQRAALPSPYDIVSIESSELSIGSWYHVAFTRVDGIARMFLNGTLVDTKPSTDNFSDAVNPLTIGDRYSSSSNSEFHGHLSNLRIIKGKGLYTASFKTPMRELEVVPGTVLLAFQSKTDASLEKTGKTLTVNDVVANELTPGILTPVVKSGGGSAITGSVEFDGTGDYLRINDNDDFAFGTGDFTVEAWIRRNGPQSDNSTIVCTHNNLGGSDNANWQMSFGKSENSRTNMISFFIGDANDSNDVLDDVVLDEDWTHISATRSGTTLKLFKNGVEISSATSSDDLTHNDLSIGQNRGDFAYYKGFISNLRIVKGTALYTADFIPPTRELKRVPGTVLLCCQDEDSVTTETTGKTITSNGDPAASNFTPQVGDDRKVTFEGVTKINSNAYFYLPTGDTITRDTGSGRGVLGGGQNPGNVGTIDFVTIQSMGNSLDFGDLNQTGQQGGCSSSTRGLFANGSNSNTIDFITIPTTGNALDFGDRTVSLNGVGALSSSTRGVFLGGGSPSPQSDVMDYVTIASTGDAIDFGNLTTANKNPAGCSSPVRGVIALGGSPGEVNTIDFITIASTGNSLDFGDCTEVGEGRSAFSSSIRGIFTGSYSTPAVIDVIQYVTISSKGNATDFGNLVLARTEGAGTSDSIRGLSFGGFTPGSPITPQNIIDYVTITTTGNAKDFGDLTQARQYPGACSDSHGGLG